MDPFNEGCGSGLGDIALMYGRTLTGPAGHLTAVFGNINSRSSFGGLMVFLQVGWLPR